MAHIILAEDDVSLEQIIRRLLMRHNLTPTIQVYENDRDALAAYDSTRADLLIINHHIPQ